MKELKKLSLIVVVLLLSATAALAAGKPNIPVSYTHLTLPTNSLV